MWVVCGLCVWVVYVIDSADTELIIKLRSASCRVVLRRAILYEGGLEQGCPGGPEQGCPLI